jgi:hypothetical protein
MENEMRLAPEDEFNHPPDAAENFNESVYANAFDAGGEVGGWMRLGNRVNEGTAELSVCLYLPDGRVACQFKRPRIDANDSFDAGGLRFAVSEPFSRATMVYEGELLLLDDPSVMSDPAIAFKTAPRVPGRISWELTTVSPVHGGEPRTAAAEARMLYGPEFSRGHFNQHHAAVGTIEVGDGHWDLDGFGWRDHSWGPRYWQAIWAYRLFLGNLGRDRGLMLLRNLQEEGGSRRLGVLLVDGAYEEVLDLDVVSEWSAADEPLGATISVRTAQRQTVIEARVITMVPLRNRRDTPAGPVASRVAEGFTEFHWDGRVGYGMTEYIERVEDGRPVGVPL